MPLTDNLITEYKLQKDGFFYNHLSIEYDNHDLNVKYFDLLQNVCTLSCLYEGHPIKNETFFIV